MDDARFDRLTQTLSARLSRRRAFSLVTAAGLAGLVETLLAFAKKKGGK